MSNIQGPPTNSQPPAAPANGGRANPSQKLDAERDSDDFSQALNKQGERRDGRAAPKGSARQQGTEHKSDKFSQTPDNHGEHTSGRTTKQAQPELTRGADDLEDLFRQTYGKKETKEEPAAIATTEAARTMNVQMNRSAEIQGVDNKAMIDKIEKIADRIMINNAADVKAVKVDFKDSVLPGTEVMIRKDANGKVHIEFTTTSPESMNFLSRGEQALTETLNRKLGGDITIDIQMQNADGEQDSGDGRSREQYIADDDDSDSRGE